MNGWGEGEEKIIGVVMVKERLFIILKKLFKIVGVLGVEREILS